ncbi:unnamed protein product [Camellia sinensis]
MTSFSTPSPPTPPSALPPSQTSAPPGSTTRPHNNLVFFLASKFLKTIPQAAVTTCYVATHLRLENVSGKYLADCNEASTSKLGSNSTKAARLWSVLELMPQEFLKFLWIQPRENSKDQTNIHVYPDWAAMQVFHLMHALMEHKKSSYHVPMNFMFK